MPILERDALQARTLLSQKGEELGAERAAGLARILSEFKAQQERNGEALFPSEERQKRERATALRRLFQDRERHGLDKGAFEQLQTEAGKTLDPEATRYRAINRQFFADLTGETPEALIPQYDSLRDAYARKQWGMEKTSDKAFFSRLADEFDREEDVLTKASKAAIGDSLNGQRDWMRAYSAAGFDENAFPDKFQAWEWREKFRLAYDQTEAETAHFAPEAKSFVDALQRSMTGGATDGDDAILSGFRERLIDAPKDERDSMLRAITVYGATVGESVTKGDAGGANALAPAKTAVDGWFQQAGESAARIVRGMAAQDADLESALSRVPLKSAKLTAPIDSPEAARKFVTDEMMLALGESKQTMQFAEGGGAAFIAAREMGRPGEWRDLTPEERTLIETEKARVQRSFNVAREIEQIAQSTDPIKSVTASTLGSSLAIMTPLMVSPSSAIVIAKGYSNLEYNQLRLKEPDMIASDAAIISLASGAVQAALDLAGVKALKALPSVRLLFEGKATRELAKRAILQTGKVYAFENVIEGAQDATTPILQGLWAALEKDVPRVDWEAEKKHWIGTRANVAIGMLPLTLIGTGVSTVADVRNSRRLLANASLLEASGLGRDIAVEVADLAATGRVEEAGRVLASAWQSRSAASAEAFAEIEADQQQRMDAFTRLSEAGILPGMRRTNEGWALTFQDGTLTEFGSHTDADAARWEYASNQSLSVAEEMRRTITDLERQLEPGREIVYEFSPERMDTARAEAEGLASREALQQRVDVGRALAGEFSEAQDAARVASVDAESAQAIVPILGMNQSQWVEGIQRTVIKLYQGASPLTLVEEKLEADVSRMMKTGRAPWLIAALREYERVSGDTLFRKGVADDQLEGTDIREAYSHLGTSYFVGRSRRENSPALTAKGFRKLAADMMRTKLGGVLTAYGHFFRSVFRRAAKLRSLTKDGKLNPELEAELARSLGIGDEQQEQVAQEKEAERLAMELRNAVQERDTTHRVFEGGIPLAIKSGLGVLDARDPNWAFRITGKSQIEDMVSSGQVRAREGKMRGGRTGETQWSRGHKSLGYRALGNSGRFVIVAKLEGLHQRRGGLPVSDVAEIWQEENGTWINVTSQIKEKAAENEATELADTLDYNPSGDAPFSMLVAPGNSQKIEEVSFGEIFKTEEIEGDISALSELEAISKRFGLPRPLDAANILENWVRIGIAEQQGATEEDAVEARKLVTRYKGETISPPEVDEFYYHVTTKKNAKAIFKSGEIKPGQSGQFSTAATRSNSHGRVFVSERGGVQFWVDRIQEQLDDRESREKLTVLRIPKAFVIDPKADNALELRGDSFYTESPISTKDAPFSMLVEGAGFSAITPAQDTAYLQAVEAGDMKKAQRMVDEAARAAIESNPRNAVKLGRFLSKSEYESVREQIEELPREVFYVGNVEVIRNPTGDDIRGMTNEERSARGGRRSVDPDTRFTKDNYGNTWRWKATGGMHSMIEPSISRREGVEVNQNNGTPYHSDLVKDAIRSGEYIPSSTLSEYPNYADFVKPSSANPVTYDDAGKVIPLSQRFNPERDEISFSALNPEQDRAYLAAAANPTRNPGYRKEGRFFVPDFAAQKYLSGKTRLYRAADEAYAEDGQSFTESVETADAYRSNPGFGGSALYAYDVDTSNALRVDTLADLAVRTSKKLPENVKEWLEDSNFNTLLDAWQNYGFGYTHEALHNPWGPKGFNFQKHLAEQGFDWLVFTEDYPANAKTYWLLKEAGLEGVPVQTNATAPLGAGNLVTPAQDAAIIPLSQRFNPERDEISFSALPRNVASDPQDFEARLARMFDPFQRSPELRQQIGLLAQQRAIEAIRKWQPIAAIAGRTKADIDRERKARIESGIADRVAALDQSVFEALAIPDELLDPRDYPVFDKLLRRKTYKRKDGKTVGYWAGMLESPSAYMKRTGKARAADEYDGMGDLPTWVFGGSLTPDEAADMVGVDGTNALWDEIHRSIDSAKLRTQERATAQAEVDRIESEARAEANEWAAREESRLDSVATQRENLTGAIRTLNAMISALPPEVRGKIGGFVTLSKKVGPAALLRELMDRAGKMESELEVWLRKDIDRQVFKLLEKAKPAKDKAGKKKVGKAGADIHALFDEIRAAIRMDATEAEAQAVALETKAMADNATAEQEAHYTLAASMVRLFGDWRNADAARRSAAHDAAKATWEKGYLEWQTKKRLEREQREEIRQALIVATGSAGTAGERDKRMNADNGFRGFLRKAGLNLLPFEGVLRYAFGDASPEAQRLADMEREASNQKDDAMFSAMGEVDDLFAGMAGGRLAGAKLRFELAQKSVTVGERTMSQLEMLQAVLMWRQPDGQRHMIGQLDETGKPSGAWHYGPEFMAEVEAKLSSEAREVLAFISDRYAAEWETLNPIYAELNGVNLPRNANYAPLTVKPMTASAGDMVDPVTGSASSSRSSTPGSLRSRGVAIAEPDFRDALQTYVAHRKQMEHWKAYARFSRDARAVLGNRNVSNSVSAINQEAATVLKNWIDDIEAGGNRDAAAHLTLSRGIAGMTNRAAAMGVVGRIGTIALQSSQLMAASAEMPPMAFWSRFGALMAGRLDWRAAMRSDYIQRRIKQMPPIVQQAMEGFESGKPNAVKYAARQLAKTIPGADGFFTAGTFAIVLDYQRSQLLKSGFPAAEAERRALAAAERITDRVAQPTRLGARSLLENRAGTFMRLIWAFSSEARKNVGIMLGAIMRGNVAETARGIGYVVVLNGLVGQFIRSAMRDLRDDDDEDLFDEKHWNPERLGLAVATDWLYGIPVIGDQLERAAYKLAGEYVPEGSLFREIQGAIPALYRLDELAAGELESEEALRDLETIVTAMGYFNDTLAGAASFAHLIRDAAGIAENIEGTD